MPQWRVNVSVRQRGPIFKAAQSRAAARRMIVAVNEEIAQEGVNRVKAVLNNVLKNPSGYYESKIAVQKRQIYRGVWDSNVIYGGWLEGVSSLNAATRFKGYFTFRKVRQALNQDSDRIAAPIIAQFLRELGG